MGLYLGSNKKSRVNLVAQKTTSEELKPSEGLDFGYTYDPEIVMDAGTYGVIGKGSCTDSVIVVPCANPENGRPVVCVGVRDHEFNVSGFDCTGVSELHLPDTVTALLSLAGGTFDNDTFADLRLIKFGRYHTFINSPLNHWSRYRELVWDFSDLKTPDAPLLLDSFALGGVVQIKVPMAMVDKFKTATNWSAAADRIIGVGSDTGGDSGAVTQTWTLNSSNLDLSTNASWEIPFTSLGTIYGGSDFVKLEIKDNKDLCYTNTGGTTNTYYSTDWSGDGGGTWGPPDYNVLTFTTALPADLAAWLAANGTKTA